MTADPPYRLAMVQSHPIQYFSPLFRRLATRPDIDLTVFYCRDTGVKETMDREFGVAFTWDIPLLEGYRWRFLRNLSPSDSTAGLWSAINPGIIPALVRGRFDALWVHGHRSLTILLAMVTARVLGVPVLMRGETHLLSTPTGWKGRMRRPLMTFLYRYLCTAVLPIGTLNDEFYAQHGVPPDRRFLVPYVVDNELFSRGAAAVRRDRIERRGALGLPATLPLILFSAKLIPRKRPMDVLQAYAGLRRRGLEAGLVFVGAGSEEDELRTYVRKQGVPDVYFHGFRNQSEMPEMYALADVFVISSEYETWGLAVNEAMAAGLPVVASSAVGAARDLIRDGENGRVYPVGNVEALSARLEELIANPGLRERMSSQSQEIIARWGIEQAVEGIERALLRVTGSTAG